MRSIAVTVCAAALAACVGCQTDYYAEQLVKPNTSQGRVLQALCGSSDQLVSQNRISTCERIDSGGVGIDTWVIESCTGLAEGTMVLLHGLGESKATHLPIGQRLADKGFDVVLIDLRAHGRSEGQYITYGLKESRDVKAVMNSLISRDIVRPPLYVFGVTLGAATAIQYAGIDPRVQGVLAVAPYQDARSIMRRQIALMAATMSEDDFELVMEHAAEMADFDPAAASAVAAAPKINGPLVLVHGLLDLTVPVEHSQAIYNAANEPKKLTVLTPVEQLGLIMMLEDWLADRAAELARPDSFTKAEKASLPAE